MRWRQFGLGFLLLLAGCGENIDYLKADRLGCRFSTGKQCSGNACTPITAPKKPMLTLDFEDGRADYMSWLAELIGKDYLGDAERIVDVKTSSENRSFSMRSNRAQVQAVLSKSGYVMTTETRDFTIPALEGAVLTFEASCRACQPITRQGHAFYSCEWK